MYCRLTFFNYHTRKSLLWLIMSLKTNKNFIISNDIENILVRYYIFLFFFKFFSFLVAKVQKEKKFLFKKKRFRKIPNCLQTIKQKI